MDPQRITPERKLCDHVYDAILALIASGEFALSARLPSEIALGRRFGASRPVVREALARLRDDGLVQSRRGSGSYVTRQPDAGLFRFAEIGSVADIQRCYEFRAGFEAGAAALAASAWREGDMAELREAHEALNEALAGGELAVDADARFHRAVAGATRNSYYVSVQRSLEANIRHGMNLSRNLSLLKPESRMRRVQAEHQAIFAAIEARESVRAAEAMARHVEAARRRMFHGETE